MSKGEFMKKENEGQEVKGFDLADLSMADTSELEIYHPKTGESMGIFITLSSMYSDRVEEVKKRGTARLGKFWREVRSPNLNAREQERFNEITEMNGEDLLVGATVSWRSTDLPGKILLKGQELDCTPENVRRLYREIVIIRNQVDRFLGRDANFLPS
jgi:hypothetical protein